MAAFKDVDFCNFLHLWLPVLIQTIQLGVETRVTLGTVWLRSVKEPQNKLLASVHSQRIQGGRWLAVVLPLLPDLGILEISKNSQFVLQGSAEYFVAGRLTVCSEPVRERILQIFKKFKHYEALVTVASPTGLRCRCSDPDLLSGLPLKKRRKVVRQRGSHVEDAVGGQVCSEDGGSLDGGQVSEDGGSHGGSHGEAAFEEAAGKHHTGQHVQDFAHDIGLDGASESDGPLSSGSPAGLCDVPEIVRETRVARTRKRRNRHPSDGSPCGEQAAVVGHGVLESQEKNDELAAVLLESAQCAEDDQDAEDQCISDLDAALLLSLSEAKELELGARDAETAMTISQSEIDASLEREARERALADGFARRYNREVIETAPNGEFFLLVRAILIV